ncbi:hypothetical protein F0562_018083 [Nyssa sinensis]|uniref:TCP domain-containing protein n=1 Tax=Nyssa sinensis TaxID=561372 RepID=A0A5J4ZB20_9ASTE|nr:hypothetical protein F0562_018083 [Nyssa sinensis]
MEVDKIQTQACKFPRIGNGRIDSNKIGQKGEEQYPDDEEEGEVKRRGVSIAGSGGSNIAGGLGRLCGWPSSRIVRVSRASGGKDRHSKVWTSKGLRDRRVRLSVTTAIQFYDLQDRLGYDQPSKAVEWLLTAAASSIAELPSINTAFPDTPRQLSDEKRSSAGTEQGLDSAEMELDGDPNYQQQQQHVSLSKSACSSTSETSKGSGLSLSRSESRIKARERARERAAEKEKEKENESHVANHSNVNPISQSSFTELLTGGISSVNNNTTSPNVSAQHNPANGESNLFHRSTRQWSSTPMDNFASGLFGPSSSRTHHTSSGFSGQIHLGNSLPQSMMVSPFNVAGDHHPELQHFSFVQDHLVPAATAAGESNYNLNFTISSGVAGFNRGTLQSNSPSLLPHLQRKEKESTEFHEELVLSAHLHLWLLKME